MKFNKRLQRELIEEWRAQHINYKSLKKQIKRQLPKYLFEQSVMQELRKVSTFYSLKFHAAQMQLTTLEQQAELVQRVTSMVSSPATAGAPAAVISNRSIPKLYKHQVEILIQVLSQFLIWVKKLRHYAWLNSEGFRKILKKYDKQLSSDLMATLYRTQVVTASFQGAGDVDKLLEGVSRMQNNVRDCIQHPAVKAALGLSSSAANAPGSSMSPASMIRSRSFSTASLYSSSSNLHRKGSQTSISGMADLSTFHGQLKSTVQNTVQEFLHTSHDMTEPSAQLQCQQLMMMSAFGAYPDGIQQLAPLLQVSAGKVVDPRQSSLVLLATESGDLETLRTVMRLPDIDPNIGDWLLRRPLHVACTQSLSEMVKVLIDNGAETNAADANLCTPLHYAAQANDCSSIKLLIEAGAAVSSADINGCTPIHMARTASSLKCFAEGLDDPDVLFSIRDERGRTAIHMAAERGDTAAAAFLLQYESQISIKDAEMRSALHVAARGGYNSFMQSLLKFVSAHFDGGVDSQEMVDWVNEMDSENQTALHLAAQAGNLDACHILVSAGSDCNQCDLQGFRPLSLACLHGHRDVAEYLNPLTEKLKYTVASTQSQNSSEESEQRHPSRSSSCGSSKDTEDENPPSLETLALQSDHLSSNQNAKSDKPDKGNRDNCYVAVTLKLKADVKEHHSVFVIGGTPTLGNWDTSNAVLMTRNKGVLWSVTLSLPQAQCIPFKFFIACQRNGSVWGRIKRWETFPSDRTIEVKRGHQEDALTKDCGKFGRMNPRSKGSDTLACVDGAWLHRFKQLRLVFGPHVLADREQIGHQVVELFGNVHNEEKATTLQIQSADGWSKMLQLSHDSDTVAMDCVELKEIFPIQIHIPLPAVGPKMCSATILESHVSSKYGVLRLPLVAHDGTPVGIIHVKFQVVLPVQSGNLSHALQKTSWRTMKVVGHRGGGADKSARVDDSSGGAKHRTHVEENTLLSFVTASNMGAEYIEFDVQVTRDGVPVIYHDVALTIGPARIPIASITYKEFIQAHNWRPEMQVDAGLLDTPIKNGSSNRRSHSPPLRKSHNPTAAGLGLGGGSVFTRDSLIRDRFTSLDEVCKMVPTRTGFDVEVKFPTPEEIQEFGILPERNEWVDRTLSVLLPANKHRSIFLSSFDPDVCMMLRLKQPIIPVFFLTEAEKVETPDPRRQSLHAAVTWARKSHCWGIVTESWPLITAPEIAKHVKSQGLMLVTYGAGNNDSDNVVTQELAGVDGVCVDHVAHVVKSIRERN